MTRRQWFRFGGMAVAGGALGSTAALYYGTDVEPRWLVGERVTVRSKRLPSELDGLVIGHLTDFHADPFFPEGLYRRAVDLLVAAAPDVIVLTGDFVTAHTKKLRALAAILAGLRAPLGVWAVCGNHDQWFATRLLKEALRQAGIGLLVNENVRLERAGRPWVLAGLDDMWAGRPKLGKALEGVGKDEPVVLLVHEPDFADEAAGDGRILLQLSGHSHGGQVRLPVWGAPILPVYGRKYDCGLFPVGEMQVYTNRGLGVVGVPVRVNCPPEAALITLRRAA